jgi:hypothetical protein
MGTYLLSHCLLMIRGYTYRHRGGGLTEELLEVVFSLWPDPKLYSKDNFLIRTVVSSQLHHAETQKLKDLITELPSNGHLCDASLAALFSDVMSHVVYMFIWYCNGISSGSTTPAFMS